MKFTIHPLIFAGVILNLATLSFVGSRVVATRLNSQNAQTARKEGLSLVANLYKADNCWIIESSTPYKLGDLVRVPGTLLGRMPTSCVQSPGTQQILHVAYLNDELIVQHAYSVRELRNQIETRETK